MATSTQAVTFGGFKDIEEKQFYERTLLQPSREEHVLDQFTEKYPLPKNHGKTWSVRKPCRIVAPDSVLTEGVIPAPNDFAMEEYVASIQNYGDYIKFSDESQLYSVDSMKAVLTDEMGYSFKDFLEGKRYQLFTSSKNRWYAGLTTVPTTQTEAGYKAAITKKGIVLDDLRKIAAFFQRNRVRGGKGSSFVFLVSPEILAETRTLTKTAEGGEYTFIDKLPDNWPSYDAQKIINGKGAPTEKTIRLSCASIGRDIVCADKKLVKKQPELLEKGLEHKAQAPDTVTLAEYEKITETDIYDFEEE